MARFDSLASTENATDDVHASPAVQAVDRRQAGRGRRKTALVRPDSSNVTTTSNGAFPPVEGGAGRPVLNRPKKQPQRAHMAPSHTQ